MQILEHRHLDLICTQLTAQAGGGRNTPGGTRVWAGRHPARYHLSLNGQTPFMRFARNPGQVFKRLVFDMMDYPNPDAVDWIVEKITGLFVLGVDVTEVDFD